MDYGIFSYSGMAKKISLNLVPIQYWVYDNSNAKGEGPVLCRKCVELYTLPAKYLADTTVAHS